MSRVVALAIAGACALLFAATAARGAAPDDRAPARDADTTDAAPVPARTMSDVLAATTPADWRPLDPESTLYLQLATGRVVIELAPAFAPEHVANIRTLVREKYFDGLAMIRSQDNFVVQWGDAEGKRSLGGARKTLPPEFTVKAGPGLPFTALPDRDGYAPEAGFSQGLPAGRRPGEGRGLARALLRHGRRRARQRARQRQRRRTLRGDRTRAAPARSQHRARGPRRAGHGTAGDAAARHGPARFLRAARASTCRSGRCGSRPTCRRPKGRTWR